jgi:hypothetical protein
VSDLAAVVRSKNAGPFRARQHAPLLDIEIPLGHES